MNDEKFSLPAIRETHKVPHNTPTERLSEYARDLFVSLPSRKSVKKAIKAGLLRVDGAPSHTGHWVSGGEVLTHVEDNGPRVEYTMQLKVVFEDAYLAAVIKPADLPVGGVQRRTLTHALASNLEVSSAPDALRYPVPVHRLDRLTGGLVIVAKTLNAASALGDMFVTRKVDKTYLAVVHGHLNSSLILDESLEGKDAFSAVNPHFRGIHTRVGKWTLVEVKPTSGRYHQIRKHLSGAGYPIAGDVKYGGQITGGGLMLCAPEIRFPHPIVQGDCHFRMEIPKKFRPFMRNGQ